MRLGADFDNYTVGDVLQTTAGRGIEEQGGTDVDTICCDINNG